MKFKFYERETHKMETAGLLLFASDYHHPHA